MKRGKAHTATVVLSTSNKQNGLSAKYAEIVLPGSL